MNIVKLKAPPIQPPKMCCDEDLHKKLNDFELTTYLNSHSTNLLLGKPKSGKSSLMWAFLTMSIYSSPNTPAQVLRETSSRSTTLARCSMS